MNSRKYNYLDIDQLIEDLLWSSKTEFKFSIKSGSKNVVDHLLTDCGLEECNSLITINEWAEDEEPMNFERIFIFEQNIFVCSIEIKYDGTFTEAFVSNPIIYENIFDFYTSSFENGIVFHPPQISEIFGKENDPVALMMKAFKKIGYSYVLTGEYDDLGLMYNKLQCNNEYFYLIGPQIERTDILRCHAYFNLYNYERLVEDYGESMIEIPELYLSFGELFSIIENQEKLEKYLISEQDFKNLHHNF